MARHPGIAFVVRTARALVHFGPWRYVCRDMIKRARPCRSATSGEQAHEPTVLPKFSQDAAVSAIHEHSHFVAGVLSHDLVARLRQVTDALPRNAYTHFHESDADVRALVTDPALMALLRRYFGAEPELLECTMVVHEPTGSGEETYTHGSQRWFHFDFGGWHSLNMFIYLTDVDTDGGAHEVAAGSHRRHTLVDLVKAQLRDEEAYARFGETIRTITGPAGTVFFEDTEAFHRRRAIGTRRVMLNVLYASHRGFLSHGRPGLTYAEYLGRRRLHA